MNRMSTLACSFFCLLAAPAVFSSEGATPPGIMRVPEERFVGLPDYPFEPNYLAMPDGARMHYVDEGKGAPVLMLHGEPTWSYLYRKIIPPVVKAGYRAVVPDHIGFGKSDKYVERSRYTFDAHFKNLESLVIERLDLHDITLVCQDWGGILGLAFVSKYPERFSRLVIMNTMFLGLPIPPDLKVPEGDMRPSQAEWIRQSNDLILNAASMGEFMRSTAELPHLTDEEVRAYSAPFPDRESLVGALAFPHLIPPLPTVVKFAEVRQNLARWDKPVLLIWGDNDGIFPLETTGEAMHRFFKSSNSPIRIEGGNHFVQETAPDRIASEIIASMKSAP